MLLNNYKKHFQFNLFLPLAFFLLIVVQGCAHGGMSMSGGGSRLSVEESTDALRALEKRAQNTYTVRAHGTISGSFAGRDGSYDFALVLSRPDLMRIDLLDPAVGTVGTLLFYGSYFYWFEPGKGRLVKMPVNSNSLIKLARIDLEPAQLVHILAGLPPSKPSAWIRKKDGAVLTPDQRGEIMFSSNGRLSDFVRYTNDNRTSVASQVHFSNYSQVSGKEFPREITFQSKGGSRLRIAYKTVEMNVALAGELFHLTVPSETNMVQW